MQAESPDDIQLQAACASVDTMLAELQAELTPAQWAKVARAMQVTVAVQGAALGRTLAHARASGANVTFDRRIANDDLLGKLLLVHGLHPMSPRDRIVGVVAHLRNELDLDLQLVDLVAGELHIECDDAIAGYEQVICQTLEAAVPELRGIEIRRAKLAA